ncbi:MAG: shikimate dehydrogenase [Saprospiraceae bacterium]
MTKKQYVYGLIGYPLSHSFSKKYFTEKFAKEGIEQSKYELFPLNHINELPELLIKQPNLRGLNVTIPYKQSVISYLHEIAEEAKAIGAVNVVKISDGQLKGFNSDAYGFEKSLTDLLAEKPSISSDLQALILGTGGASKAIRYVLDKMNIAYRFVTRTKMEEGFIYDEITPAILREYRLVINCTPLGTYPNEDTFPSLPYHAVTKSHFFYDLVYNPAETLFLKKGKVNGASTLNGLPMLHLQAERSWEIWRGNELIA